MVTSQALHKLEEFINTKLLAQVIPGGNLGSMETDRPIYTATGETKTHPESKSK